jgi:hypothetical protein
VRGQSIGIGSYVSICIGQKRGADERTICASMAIGEAI